MIGKSQSVIFLGESHGRNHLNVTCHNAALEAEGSANMVRLNGLIEWQMHKSSQY